MEYQGRGTQYFHATIHVENAPKIDEDADVVTEFINKYISHELSNSDQYLDLNAVVKQVHWSRYIVKIF